MHSPTVDLEFVDDGKEVTPCHRYGHIHLHIRLSSGLPHCILKVVTVVCKAARVTAGGRWRWL